MIQAHELRIGNIIQYNDGDICRVIGISEFGLDVEFKEETTYIEHDHFSGIPLTEEILLKCGFVLEDEDRFILKDDDFDYVIDTDVEGLFLIGLRYSKEVNYFCSNIIYIHQLQNLFNSLGVTLKIEL